MEGTSMDKATFTNKNAERMKKLKELHLKRVSVSGIVYNIDKYVF